MTALVKSKAAGTIVRSSVLSFSSSLLTTPFHSQAGQLSDCIHDIRSTVAAVDYSGSLGFVVKWSLLVTCFVLNRLDSRSLTTPAPLAPHCPRFQAPHPMPLQEEEVFLGGAPLEVAHLLVALLVGVVAAAASSTPT